MAPVTLFLSSMFSDSYSMYFDTWYLHCVSTFVWLRISLFMSFVIHTDVILHRSFHRNKSMWVSECSVRCEESFINPVPYWTA